MLSDSMPLLDIRSLRRVLPDRAIHVANRLLNALLIKRVRLSEYTQLLSISNL